MLCRTGDNNDCIFGSQLICADIQVIPNQQGWYKQSSTISMLIEVLATHMQTLKPACL